MNCRKKDGLSLLLKAGGKEGYGAFWIIQELYMEMQIHKDEPVNFFIINEATLLKELQINCRSFPKLIELFSETIGILFEKIPKTIGNVSYMNWKITLPKSLIFTKVRNKKIDNKNKNKNKNKIEIEKEKGNKDTKKVRTWRTDFWTYLKSEILAYKEITADQEFIKEQSELNPNVDILLSLKKAHLNFWGKPAGWNYKKNKKAATINWRLTFTNAIDINKVYKPRQSGGGGVSSWSSKHSN